MLVPVSHDCCPTADPLISGSKNMNPHLKNMIKGYPLLWAQFGLPCLLGKRNGLRNRVIHKQSLVIKLAGQELEARCALSGKIR